jgi:FlaA1/EpsC-like NDP-sugar epimerase
MRINKDNALCVDCGLCEYAEVKAEADRLVRYCEKRKIQLASLEPDKDIQISYTGLRPGEKLHEELLASKENSQSTSHDKIFRARVREYNHRDFSRSLLILCESAKQVDIMGTVLQMTELIPEFKSRHSRFESLARVAI